MWLILMAFHLIGQVGFNIQLRRSLLQKLDGFTLATLMQTAVTLPILFVIPFHRFNLAVYDRKALLYIFIQIFATISLHVTTVKSLQHLEASFFSVLFNLRIIIVTFLSIMLVGEKFIPLQALGGMLIFLAVLTVRQKGRHELTALGVKWGIAAALAISFVAVVEKRLILDIGYVNYAIPVMITSTFLMWAILLSRRKSINLPVLATPQLGWLMGFRAMSAFGIQLAITAGAAISLATYISSLSVILIVLFGVLLLGERDYLKQKIVATVLTTIGLTVILLAQI